MSTEAWNRTVSPGFYRVAVVASALAAACSQGDAARSNRRSAEDRFDPSVVLSGERGREVERAMASAAGGHEGMPLRADQGGRWSDVPTAIRNVANASFMGVRAFESSADRIVATTVLEDGQAGSVTATRDASGTISFECRLSTFEDPPRDLAFTDALAAEMRRLGKIRRPTR